MASGRFQADRYIVAAANTARIHLLEELRNKAKGDITSNGLKLELYPQFKNDKVVILWAVQQNPRAVKFACDRLKMDADILKELK